MKNLWAPWRMAYIEGPAERRAEEAALAAAEPCIFCRFPKTPERDQENLILHRAPEVFVIMNRYPYSNGHLMVVPYAHVDSLERLAEGPRNALLAVGARMTALLKATLNADGVNLGMNLGRAAGAGIADHLHLHLVPRWEGDSNFMPVLAETKVISEHLERTYEKLATKLAEG
jgi:ATP adenylyltransferase